MQIIILTLSQPQVLASVDQGDVNPSLERHHVYVLGNLVNKLSHDVFFVAKELITTYIDHKYKYNWDNTFCALKEIAMSPLVRICLGQHR